MDPLLKHGSGHKLGSSHKLGSGLKKRFASSSGKQEIEKVRVFER